MFQDFVKFHNLEALIFIIVVPIRLFRLLWKVNVHHSRYISAISAAMGVNLMGGEGDMCYGTQLYISRRGGVFDALGVHLGKHRRR